MKTMGALMFGVVSMIIIVASGGEVSAQSEDQNTHRKKARWAGARMVVDAGGIVLGAATFNPILFGVSTGALGANAVQLGMHSVGARRDATTSTAPKSLAQPESLVAVPGRPGYFYYPSNPNQLYFDANAAATPEPMQARLPEPARINVLIANTAKDGRSIRYSVSGTDYEVPAGYIQALVAPAGSIISYDRGDKVGTEMFTLTGGTYEFRTAEQGWRFYATNPNTANVAKAKSDARPADARKLAAAIR